MHIQSTADASTVPDELAVAGASTVACPACASIGARHHVNVPDHEYALAYVARYAECAKCRTVYQDPMPQESELGTFYPSSYHSMAPGGGGRLMDARRAMRVARLRKLIGAEHGLVLDYGCGNGSFLVAASERLPQNRYVGFEYSETTERQQLAGGKVLIIRGKLPDLLSEVDQVRVLIMNHVIEHLPDPSYVMRALVQKMAPGGLFDGQTPNAWSLEHRLFGTRWSGYHAPRHTVVFSKIGLQLFLERHGYTGISIRGAFNPAGVAVSLGSLPQRAEGLVMRQGAAWLALVVIASALMPLDLLSGYPGMINFLARLESARA
jgi:SAM-dependent methyltransferase